MEKNLIYLTTILALGSGAQWLAWKLKLPAILLLLLAGFLCGQFADPEEYIGLKLLLPAVSLSVAVILFEGGLSLSIHELREAGKVILRLVTVGALVTWVLGGLAAWLWLDFSPMMAALMGAVLTVTGPTVIGPLLQHVRPIRRVSVILKWEGIVIDPIGATLTLLVFEAMRGEGPIDLAERLFLTIFIGAIVGLLATGLIVVLLKRHLIPDFLQTSILLTFVVGAFAASNLMQEESGLIAVTLFGVALANQKWVTVNHLIEFKEHLRVLLISALFILLASTLQVNDLLVLGWPALGFLATLLVVRLLSVMSATVGSKLTWAERFFVSWIAPRGIVAAAVSSLFALKLAGPNFSPELQAEGTRFVSVTFLVIVGTVVIYGLTARWVAQRLKLADINPQGVLFLGAGPFVREMAKVLHKEKLAVLLVDTNHRNVTAARLVGLPALCASVHSEYVREQLDLGGIGRFVAATTSPEVNSLAAMELAHQFGRAEVYQLPLDSEANKRGEKVAAHHKARILFHEGLTARHLHAVLEKGGTIKKTKLTAEFTWDQFRQLYGERPPVLFSLTPSGQLQLSTLEQPLAPKVGHTLFHLSESSNSKPSSQSAVASTT